MLNNVFIKHGCPTNLAPYTLPGHKKCHIDVAHAMFTSIADTKVPQLWPLRATVRREDGIVKTVLSDSVL